MPIDPEDQQAFQERVAHWQACPADFVRDVLHEEPNPHQVLMMESIEAPGSRTSVRSGHGTGKTAGLAYSIWWGMIAFPECLIACTAPTDKTMNNIRREVKRLYRKLNSYYADQFEVVKDGIKYLPKPGERETEYAVGTKEKPEAIAGKHNLTFMLFVIDEASGVLEETFQSGRGAMSSKGARTVMCSNPTKLTGYFYNSHHRNKKRWTCLQFNGEDSDFVAQDFIDEIREESGKDSDPYRIRVEGDFPLSSSSQYIPKSWIDAAIKRYHHLDPRLYSQSPVVFGVDPAELGSDKSVCYMRQGMYTKLLGSFPQIDLMDFAAKVHEWIIEYEPDRVFIDGGGVGAGVVSRLREYGDTVVRVMFGSKPPNEDSGFYDMRAQMYARLRRALHEYLAIQEDEELMQDLLVQEQKISGDRGTVQLVSKADLHRGGLGSPDKGDALALTYAYAESATAHRATPTERAMAHIRPQKFANSKYDVLARR